MREKVPETYEEKLDLLQERRHEAVHSASEAAVEKQHAKGKLTARERIEKLLDPGSFQELDTFVPHDDGSSRASPAAPSASQASSRSGSVGRTTASPRASRRRSPSSSAHSSGGDFTSVLETS